MDREKQIQLLSSAQQISRAALITSLREHSILGTWHWWLWKTAFVQPKLKYFSIIRCGDTRKCTCLFHVISLCFRHSSNLGSRKIHAMKGLSMSACWTSPFAYVAFVYCYWEQSDCICLYANGWFDNAKIA